ncbi:MAG: peroxidase-related enzyme [Gammaproteobacteria bacterium]|nr:peroxidase-related enzyme [Gammaproteobacteria bacterium]NNF60361.1 peroxidase-related enzyme [Gammaproteobacteria bacterium]NNM20595.1 peroxidase-related enzyme [Gammaproteobacteria bacterium]
MAWIEEIEPQEATDELKEVYEQLTKQRGKVANIMKVHSLNPGAMQKHLDLYMHLMFGKSGLSRADREAIAVAVSAANDCAYCVTHHAEALARYEKDAKISDMLKGLRFLDLPDRTARILSYAVKLTYKPSNVGTTDIDELRDAGLSDRDILDVNLIAAYFNFVNRIALGLGVTFSSDEMTGYKT